MVKWNIPDKEQGNSNFKISDMNDPREKLHIFFRSHSDAGFIHSIVDLNFDPELFKGDAQSLMKIAVIREYQKGGAYYAEEVSDETLSETANQVIAENLKKGYDVLTAFVAPEDFDFIY